MSSLQDGYLPRDSMTGPKQQLWTWEEPGNAVPRGPSPSKRLCWLRRVGGQGLKNVYRFPCAVWVTYQIS